MYLVTSTIIAIFLYFLLKTLTSKKKIKEFPEPPGNPIYGHIFQINSPTEILNMGMKLVKDAKTFKGRIGPSFAPIIYAIITIDYKLTEHILTSNKVLTKSINYKYLTPWLRNGLLISDGPYWRRHRKILTPTFHFEILKNFVHIFEKVGDKLVENFQKHEGVNSVDIHPLVTLCTLDIICETAMGTEINAQSGKNTEYVKSVKEMCRIIIDRSLAPLKLFDNTFWLTGDYYIQKKALTILHGFTSGVITSKKQKGIEEKIGEKKAFLDLLLKSTDGQAMTDEELREEVDTFMFAGHDTTAASICFTLYCLANNPEIQEKVLQEQKSLFGNKKDPKITFTELQNMKYLELVIKEALRLYPAVPFLGRYAKEDIEYGGDGYVIPKGANIAIFVYGMHRNEEYFPEPERFNPDRFNTVDGSLPYIFIPFSAGPRNCIGQKFAMLEMKSVISKIIRHFEVQPAVPYHELKLTVEVVLKSSNGIKIKFKKRG